MRVLNLSLDRLNQKRDKKKKIRMVTEGEWWKVWGIIVAASPLGVGGKALFQDPSTRRLSPHVNLGTKGENIMTESRFNDIKTHLYHAFRGTDPNDKWNEIRPLTDGFNENRRLIIASSVVQVLDESMSAFRPRTTKQSLLPHISFIARKPKPLGTEFKVS